MKHPLNSRVVGILALAAACAAPTVAFAEREVAFYGGVQSAPHSRVKIYDASGVRTESFSAGWEGKSLAMPPYYGFRYTSWQAGDWAWLVNFTHAKVYSDSKTRTNNGYSVLEMTDGVNPLTVQLSKRQALSSELSMYYGGGIGISIPHVEITKGTAKTYEFQYGGPVLGAHLGLKYKLSGNWNVFGEYGFHYYKIDVDHAGGKMKTNLITNALNVGLGYSF
jgi:lipid A oxidase